ncbi:ubiquitin-protein ligase [Scheffersomyces amazonensis]|uniref:ubiquitin-protein ligase n=1 Tax=Scheffersomyces amazonensis TaxID=1078765 RepID=UPI00315D8801
MLGNHSDTSRGPHGSTKNNGTKAVPHNRRGSGDNVPRSNQGWRFKDLLRITSGGSTHSGNTTSTSPGGGLSPNTNGSDRFSNNGIIDLESAAGPASNEDPNSISISGCRCCGTVLTYPYKSHKFRCSVCNSTNVLVRPSGQQGDDKDADIHPISRSHIRHLIEKCLREVPGDDKDKSRSLHEVFEPLSSYLQTAFQSTTVINKSFKIHKSSNRSHYHSSNIDKEQIKECFDMLVRLPTKRPLYNALNGASRALKRIYVYNDEDDAQNLRWILILLEIPFLFRCLLDNKDENNKDKSSNMVEVPEIKALSYDIIKRSLGILANSETPKSTSYLASWLSKLEQEEFIRKIDLLNLYINFHLKKYFYIANNPQLIRKKPTGRISIDRRHDHPTDREYQESTNIKDEINELNQTEGTFYPTGRLDLPQPQIPLKPNNNRVNQETKIKIHQYGHDWHIKTAGRVMAIFIKANSIRKPAVPISTFYNSLVDFVNIKLDFDSWQSHKKFHSSSNTNANANANATSEAELQSVIDYIHGTVSSNMINENASYYFCNFPFLVSLGSKISVLEYEARRQMERKAEEAFITSLDKRIALDIYFKVKVRREFIVQDSLQCIKYNSNNLKKSLKVQFINEPGVDVGGLKKEWFLLLTKEMFNPHTRMLYNVEDSNLLWFNIKPIENFEMYYLFGAILGLAIYNSTILDLQFPIALYKLLLRIPIGISDYQQLFPSSYRNMMKLKELNDEALEELDITFEVTYKDVFDKSYTEELIPKGSQTKVSKVNLDLFIQKYCDFYMKTSISRQIESLVEGFSSIVGGNWLSLISPEEIQLLLCGSNEGSIDVAVLQSVTKYSGFTITTEASETNLVKWFWELFNEMDTKERKRLLLFVTGSDRIPATGIQNLNFKISLLGHGNDSNRLPIAHTCFNELALYNYNTKLKLSDKLTTAIYETSVRSLSTTTSALSSYQHPDYSTYLNSKGQDGARNISYFMVGSLGLLSAAGAKSTVEAFLSSFAASADVLAMAKVEVKLGAIPEGKNVIIKWQGKPVFIRHRTPDEIEEANQVDIKSLRDPQNDADRVIKPEWLVMLGICTHLGCVPIGEAGDFGGWFCPCHGSHYDISGRIRRGPAPLNLEIPAYDFTDDQTLLVG